MQTLQLIIIIQDNISRLTLRNKTLDLIKQKN